MSDLPIVEPPAVPTDGTDGTDRTDRTDGTRDARIHGVLLAAGTSSRFGAENKLLATIDGVPIVRHAARTLLGAELASVTAIVGHEHGRVREALSGLDVRVVRAERYEEGQSRSLRCGIEAVQDLDPTADAAVVALGDMPHLAAETVQKLLAAYEAGAGSALAAAYRGQRGNPVLFDRRHFEALTATEGDVGGRGVLLGADDAALVETGDSGVVRDIDRPDDLAATRDRDRNT